MKIEKLTENKIRIILNYSELPNKDNLSAFIYTDINTNKFFLDILNKAEKDYGFNTDNCKLLVEAYCSLEDLFIMTITKIHTSAKKNNYRIHKKKNSKLTQPLIYKFTSFEDYCLLCELLKKEKISVENIASHISLYLYNKNYYLLFNKLNLSYKNFKKLFSYISEFSICVRNTSNLYAKISEYGKKISQKNALKTGIKYFGK